MNSQIYFSYIGPIDSSKSMVNRALILQALHPKLKINYTSQAQDILELKQALENVTSNQLLSNSLTLDVGSGGTTFRFLAFYLSKFPGLWTLKLSQQLALRPKQDLIDALKQLGTEVIQEADSRSNFEFQMQTKPWSIHEATVDFAKSSQFFSGLALAASDQHNAFTIHCRNREMGSGYEQITLNMLAQIGVSVHDKEDSVIIQNLNQNFEALKFNIGADWSSVIYLLSFCFTGARIKLTNIDLTSFEPDKKGLEFLKDLGLNFKIDINGEFSILTASDSRLKLHKNTFELLKNPDLFPILAALLSQLALQENLSVYIHFSEQLAFKESNRLEAMILVLQDMGFATAINKQVLELKPMDEAKQYRQVKTFHWDSKSDHRLIMTYELLKSFGYKIHYNSAQAVQKSFANFFAIIKGDIK